MLSKKKQSKKQYLECDLYLHFKKYIKTHLHICIHYQHTEKEVKIYSKFLRKVNFRTQKGVTRGLSLSTLYKSLILKILQKVIAIFHGETKGFFKPENKR